MIRLVEHNSPLKHIQPSTLVASSITYIVIAYPVIFSSLRSRSHHCRYHGGISSGNKQICAEYIRRPSLCNASHSSQHRKTAPALAFTFATYSLKASILLPRSETLAHPNVLRPVTTLVRTGAVYGRHSARSLGCTLFVVLTSWLRVARAPHAYVPATPHDMLTPAYLWFHSRPTFRFAAAMPARHTPRLCVWYSYIHPQHKQTHHDGCKPRHDDHAPPFARCSSNRTSASYALRISSAVTGKAVG